MLYHVSCSCVCEYTVLCRLFIHFAKDFWSLNLSSPSIMFRIQSTDEHKQVQRQNSKWISIFEVINRRMASKSSELIFCKLCVCVFACIIWRNNRMRLSMMRSILFCLNAAIFSCLQIQIGDRRFQQVCWNYGHKYSTQFTFMRIKPIMSVNNLIEINQCAVWFNCFNQVHWNSASGYRYSY